jgi:hypothetical protein
VLALIRVMANTPYGSWAGCSHFGLRELLEQSSTRPERVQVALEETNRALNDLGIVDFRVDGITRDSLAGSEGGQWTITLVSTTDSTKTYRFGWNGET